jgi:hypothetical protein
VVGGLEEFLGRLVRNVFGLFQASPNVGRRRERIKIVVLSGQEIMFDDPVAVCRIGKLQAEDLGVVLRLLQAVSGELVFRFGFNDGNREIRPIAQEIVGALLFPATRLAATHDDAAIGEGPLFRDPVVVPPGGVKLWEDVFATSVGFSESHRYAG